MLCYKSLWDESECSIEGLKYPDKLSPSDFADLNTKNIRFVGINQLVFVFLMVHLNRA